MKNIKQNSVLEDRNKRADEIYNLKYIAILLTLVALGIVWIILKLILISSKSVCPT